MKCAVGLLVMAAACSSTTTTQTTIVMDAGGSTGGVASTGGVRASGGDSPHSTSTGGSTLANVPSTVRESNGGATTAHASNSSGGASIGGNPATGGVVATGASATGGFTSATGGNTARGSGSGGFISTSIGGVPTGSTSATGGSFVTGSTTSGGASHTGSSLEAVSGGYTFGGASSSAAQPTNGLAIPGNYYTQATFHGSVWATADPGRADIPGSTINLAEGRMCVSGTVAKVPPVKDAGSPTNYDYSNYWGVTLGWNLNEAASVDGGSWGTVEPANLSAYSQVVIGLDGATDLTVRVQLQVRAGDAGVETYFCIALPSTGGAIELASMRTNCWEPVGAAQAFDPATMEVRRLLIAVVSNPSRAQPFDFCVTALKFE